MTERCGRYRGWIARARFDDLEPERREALRAHLAECPACARAERGLSRTLELLHAAGDLPVPRHFFVGPGEAESIRRPIASPFWAGALAAAALIGLVGLAFLVGGLHLRVDQGVLMASIGSPPQPRLERAWSARWIDEIERRQREEEARRAAEIRRELDGLRGETAALLAGVLRQWGQDVERRFDEREGSLRRETGEALLALYRTVDDRVREDLGAVSQRIDQVASYNELQDERTEAVLTALLGMDGRERREPQETRR